MAGMHGTGSGTWIEIDGSTGEGGGQILRSALVIAALTGRPLRIWDIRARRRRPGLAAQHLTAVRAVAALCGARVEGDRLGSTELVFVPRHAPRPGTWTFDVGTARPGGSAGAAGLVLQTVALPLAFADAPSHVEVVGGTHVPLSPPADFLETVWAPWLSRIGLHVAPYLLAYGFYPTGGGRIAADIAPPTGPEPLVAEDPGRLLEVEVRALAAELPAHIPARMAGRARTLLAPLGVPIRERPARVRAASPGAFCYVHLHFEHAEAGFVALGAPGVPSERVAEQAVAEALSHTESRAALDRHMADQILLPLAFAPGPSRFSTSMATLHLETQAWLLEASGLARVRIGRGAPVTVEVEPQLGPDVGRRLR